MKMLVSLAVLLSVVPAQPGWARSPHGETTRYLCDGGKAFDVTRTGANVSVLFPDGSYELTRKRSSLGEKYVSSKAALIFDDRMAVFVAEDRLDLKGCAQAEDYARTRGERRHAES